MEILDKKIMAYLHDPPWKMFNLIHNRAFLAEGKGSAEEKLHEADSIELLRRIGINNIENQKLPVEVYAADHLSSALDRWIISKLGSNNEKLRKVVYVTKKINIFTPSKKFDFGQSLNNLNNEIIRKRINEFVDNLTKIISSTDKKYRYHLLYFITPLLWYDYFPSIPSLADTRAPTSTIFDHATATSSMINLIKCNNGKVKLEGYMISIEIPSIQEFIRISRKTRELWASSWITSLLLWKSIEKFVEQIGPDIIIRPELSLNHFYISWLLKKLNGEALKKVRDLAEKYASYNSPTVPMMSEKIYMILPKEFGTKQDIKDEILKGFKETWKIIATKSLEQIYPQLNNTSEEKKMYIENAMNEPPIIPIINIIDVSEIYEEYKKIMGIKDDPDCDKNLDDNYIFLFSYLISKLNEEGKSYKISYGSLINPEIISKITKEKYKLCNVCGLLPSSIYYLECSDKEELSVVHKNCDQIGKGETLEEEELCPYCAVKRNMRKEIVEKILDEENLEYDENSITEYPSVSILSMQGVLDYMSANSNEKLGKDFSKHISTFAEALCNIYSKEPANEAIKKRRNDTINILREFNIDEKTFNKLGNIYYAIIRGDGDYLGRGYWNAMLANLQSDDSNKKRTQNLGIYDYVSSILTEVYGKESFNNKVIEGIINNISEKYKKLFPDKELGSTIITPSYIYALSRSLTVQSVVDLKILKDNEAFPIYVGGDDLLAFSPVYIRKIDANNKTKVILTSLDVVEKTRESYWKYNSCSQKEYDGFKIVNFKCNKNSENNSQEGGIVVDSLRSYGRSYSIYISHYKDPLSLSLYVSGNLLEKKDDIEGKDVLFISYRQFMPNISNIAMIKLGDTTVSNDEIYLIRKIYEMIENSEFSEGFIYDSLNSEKYLTNENEIKSKIIERILKRNIKNDKNNYKVNDIIEKLNEIYKFYNIKCKDEICEACKKDPFIHIINSIYILR